MSNEPILRVVRGEPSDEELAALVAVVSSLRPAPQPEPTTRSAWARRNSLVRSSHSHGPGAWRASGLPR